MPIYSYACRSCGNEFELRQSFSAEPEQECPVCSNLANRKIHAVGVIYKGSGFYTTDYARKSNGSSERSSSGSGSSSTSSGESTSSSSESQSEGSKSDSGSGAKSSSDSK